MDSATPVHLYNLALYNPSNAILCNHAVNSDNYAYQNGLVLPPGVSHCDGCGVVHIPGLTCTSQVTYTKKTKKSYRTRVLEVTCLACRHKKSRAGLLDKKRVAMPTVAGPSNDRKKKKKKSELSSMLATKKQQDSKKTLSLFEFMQ